MSDEVRMFMNSSDPEEIEKSRQQAQLAFKLNHTMPMTDEYTEVMHRLFTDMGEGSIVNAPVQVFSADKVSIGKNVLINGNCLMMSQGGIIIEDDVVIAANVSLLTNNHDPYERQILTCKPVTIRKGAWIGAGAFILPGVTVGKYAVVGAAAVVTKDVPDHSIVVGSPAKVVKTLDATRFE